MGRVKHHVDNDNHVLVTWVPAAASARDFAEMVEIVSNNPDLDNYHELTVIEDLSTLIPRKGGYSSTQELAKDLENRYGDGAEWRSAYLVGSKVDFGLLRVYMTYRGRSPEVARGFIDDLDGALAWVGIPASQHEEYRALIDKLKSAGNPG